MSNDTYLFVTAPVVASFNDEGLAGAKVNIHLRHNKKRKYWEARFLRDDNKRCVTEDYDYWVAYDTREKCMENIVGFIELEPGLSNVWCEVPFERNEEFARKVANDFNLPFGR